MSPEQAKIGLDVTLNATHSGSIVNGRVYRGKAMKASIPSWTQPYEKPVLKHHQREEDAIGRVKSAKYIPLMSDAEIEKDYLTCKKDTAGSGYTQLKANITDPDSIQKVIDGRYRTVSYGFETNAAICTICGADWMKDGFFACPHRPGRAYPIDEKSLFWEGKKTKKEFPAYLVTGDIDNREVSMVNIPAQALAGITDYKLNKPQDSQVDEVEFTSFMKMFYGEVDARQDGVSSLVLTDGLVSQEVLIDDLVSQKVRNLSIFDAPAVEDKKEGDCGKDSAPKVDEVPPAKPEDKPAYSDDEVARINLLQNLYDKGYADLTEAEAGELIDFTDAKLSEAQRERLSKSTFCGPNCSWPISDASHVKTARSFLSDSAKTKNLSEGQKASIRACVNRKAKALGCPGDEESKKSRDNSGGPMPDDINAVVKDLTDKLAALTTELATVKAQLSEAGTKIKTSDDARAKVHNDLTDSLVGQFVTMRRVIDPSSVPAEEPKMKEMVEKLKLRSVDSLRDAVADMAPVYATKVADLQKPANLADHAGKVETPADETVAESSKAPVKAKDLL